MTQFLLGIMTGTLLAILGAEIGYLVWARRQNRRDRRSRISFWVQFYSLAAEQERRYVKAETEKASQAA